MKAVRNLGAFHGKFSKHCEQKGSVQLCSLSSKCDRPRTRSSITIWNLPDSLLVMILKGIHIKDLLSFRSVHSSFCDIIDNHTILWTAASFSDCWPQEGNLNHFIKASNCGNVEATIKLAVAYLYKEGLTKEDVSKIASEAATYLSLAESLTPGTFPFFWIFIRPPWALDGSCCKVQAFKHIKDIVDKDKNRDLAFGIALTLKLQRLSVQGVSKSEEQKYFELAATQQSAAATFFSLLDVMHDEVDSGKEFEKIRLLRQLSSANILEAKLNLVRHYIQGQYGGVTEVMAKDYVCQFFTSSKPSGIHMTFSAGLTSDISRYILVDWLVEVVGMKDFSAHTLYLAVSLFDRYLQLRTVQRSKVQLLGVAAMVISSRFLGFDILTIREAAWLTDNSYTYHDVVRMMGELVATVKGNIRELTIQDYVKILLAVTGEGGYMAMLVEYIAMLCLLQSEMGQYSPAEVAASCVLLSRLLMNKDDPWPERLKEWTGFSQDYLSLCTFHIHKKCLLEGSEVDYRDTKLQAVKLRYADTNRCSVSNIEVIGHRELCRRLGVTKLVNHGKNTKAIRFRNTDELIVSPRRGKKRPGFLRNLNQSFDEENVDRSNAATPPIKHSSVFEDSISGYDGDLEEDSDELMSDKSDFLYELTGDSDLDHSNACDHFDESHDWDSEVSVMEDEPTEDLDDTDTEASCYDKLDVSDGKIVCLSSMCQSRNSMTSQASRSPPSCCISNCSCQQPFTLVGLNLKRQSSEQTYQQYCAKNYSFTSSGSTPFSSSSSSSSSLPSTSSASSSSSTVLSPIHNTPVTFSTPSSSSMCTSSSSSAGENLSSTDGVKFSPCGDVTRRLLRRPPHSSSLASSSTCDNSPPLSICDDRDTNYTHSFVLNSACSCVPLDSQTLNSLQHVAKTSCSCSVAYDTPKKAAFQVSQLSNAFVLHKNIPVGAHCTSKKATVMKNASANVSSFIEISCPSTQPFMQDSNFSNSLVAKDSFSPKRSQRLKKNVSSFTVVSSASSYSNPKFSCSESLSMTCYPSPVTATCLSSSSILHETSPCSTSASLDGNVSKRLTRSSNITITTTPSQDGGGQSPFGFSETPSSFMSVKKARLEQSSLHSASSEAFQKVNVQKYSSNAFTSLSAGNSSSCPCENDTEMDNSGQYFSLPSRLKRKKTC